MYIHRCIYMYICIYVYTHRYMCACACVCLLSAGSPGWCYGSLHRQSSETAVLSNGSRALQAHLGSAPKLHAYGSKCINAHTYFGTSSLSISTYMCVCVEPTAASFLAPKHQAFLLFPICSPRFGSNNVIAQTVSGIHEIVWELQKL